VPAPIGCEHEDDMRGLQKKLPGSNSAYKTCALSFRQI
jgi:hypothetical protein